MLYLFKSWLSALLKFRSYFHLTFMKTEPALQISKGKKLEIQTMNKDKIRFIKLIKKPKFSCTQQKKSRILKFKIEQSASSS